MEITKEEFLKAVEVVESYYKQVNSHIQQIKDREELSTSTMKVGDFVVFTKNRTSAITIGKEYEIVAVDYKLWRYNNKYSLEYYTIITDDGILKKYKHHTTGVEYYRSK
jgi:hypothetical protein